jgi:hypothetical protein
VAEDRFRRFRHLERPRAAGSGGDADAPAPRTEAGARFEALEGRRAAPEASVADGHLDRFRPAAERPIEIAPTSADELPFVRCAACQMDHHRGAASCTQCGADLGTDAQRAFNAGLAVERRAAAAREALASEAYRRGRAEADEEVARAKREMGELLAREVGNAERRRLDAEGLGGFGGLGGWGSGGDRSSWGDATGWRRGLGIAGWILLGVLRVLFRPRRRW